MYFLFRFNLFPWHFKKINTFFNENNTLRSLGISSYHSSLWNYYYPVANSLCGRTVNLEPTIELWKVFYLPNMSRRHCRPVILKACQRYFFNYSIILTHSLHYPDPRCFTLCRLVFCKLLQHVSYPNSSSCHSFYLAWWLVFAGPVHRTEKNPRTELNRTMVRSIFRLRLPEFGAIPVAGCRVSKIF